MPPRWQTSNQRVSDHSDASNSADFRHGQGKGAVDLPSPFVVRDPAFVRLLSFLELEPEYKVQSRTQLACPRRKLSVCLLRAQTSDAQGWSGAHQRWVNFVCDPIVSDAHSSLSGSKMGSVERRSRNSSLQRETRSGELGRCIPVCFEKI